MKRSRSLPSDDEVRAIFWSAIVTEYDRKRSKNFEKLSINEWVRAFPEFNPLKKWWIEDGAEKFIHIHLSDIYHKLCFYDPLNRQKRIDGINKYIKMMNSYVEARNNLMMEYVGGKGVFPPDDSKEPNYYLFSEIATPFPKPPGAWNDIAELGRIKSSDPEIQAMFDGIAKETRAYEASNKGKEWKRYWEEFHDDIQQLLDNKTSDAIGRLYEKAISARKRIEGESIDGAPRALWRIEFVMPLCGLWHGLFSVPPGSNPDHRFVGFVEACWQTTIQCASEYLKSAKPAEDTQDAEKLVWTRNVLNTTKLNSWAEISWERAIRAAVRRYKAK